MHGDLSSRTAIYTMPLSVIITHYVSHGYFLFIVVSTYQSIRWHIFALSASDIFISFAINHFIFILLQFCQMQSFSCVCLYAMSTESKIIWFCLMFTTNSATESVTTQYSLCSKTGQYSEQILNLSASGGGTSYEKTGRAKGQKRPKFVAAAPSIPVCPTLIGSTCHFCPPVEAMLWSWIWKLHLQTLCWPADRFGSFHRISVGP